MRLYNYAHYLGNIAGKLGSGMARFTFKGLPVVASAVQVTEKACKYSPLSTHCTAVETFVTRKGTEFVCNNLATSEYFNELLSGYLSEGFDTDFSTICPAIGAKMNDRTYKEAYSYLEPLWKVLPGANTPFAAYLSARMADMVREKTLNTSNSTEDDSFFSQAIDYINRFVYSEHIGAWTSIVTGTVLTSAEIIAYLTALYYGRSLLWKAGSELYHGLYNAGDYTIKWALGANVPEEQIENERSATNTHLPSVSDGEISKNRLESADLQKSGASKNIVFMYGSFRENDYMKHEDRDCEVSTALRPGVAP